MDFTEFDTAPPLGSPLPEPDSGTGSGISRRRIETGVMDVHTAKKVAGGLPKLTGTPDLRSALGFNLPEPVIVGMGVVSTLYESFLRKKFLAGESVMGFSPKHFYAPLTEGLAIAQALTKELGYIVNYSGEGSALIGVSESQGTYVTIGARSTEFSSFTVYGSSSEQVAETFKLIESFGSPDERTVYRWFYTADGHSIEISDVLDTTISQDLYPYIPDLEQFMTDYLASTANILVLYGPPGTGKSSFLKHLVARENKLVYISYDEQVLSRDFVFVEFVSNPYVGSFIIEDADNMIRPRADGNSFVSKFLNVGDGIIKVRGKKLIFSTNLNDKSQMDPALIRPGRCFDVVHFRELSKDEAEIVAHNRNLILPNKAAGSTYSLGEIFNATENRTVQPRRMGFV